MTPAAQKVDPEKFKEVQINALKVLKAKKFSASVKGSKVTMTFTTPNRRTRTQTKDGKVVWRNEGQMTFKDVDFGTPQHAAQFVVEAKEIFK